MVVHLTAGNKQLFTLLCTVRAGDCIFFYGKRNENQLGAGGFVHDRIVSAVNLLKPARYVMHQHV